MEKALEESREEKAKEEQRTRTSGGATKESQERVEEAKAIDGRRKRIPPRSDRGRWPQE